MDSNKHRLFHQIVDSVLDSLAGNNGDSDPIRMINHLIRIYDNSDPCLIHHTLDREDFYRFKCLGDLDSLYLVYYLFYSCLKNTNSLFFPLTFRLVEAIVRYLAHKLESLSHILDLIRQVLELLTKGEMGTSIPTFPFQINVPIYPFPVRFPRMNQDLIFGKLSIYGMDDLERIEMFLVGVFRAVMECSELLCVRLNVLAFSTVKHRISLKRYIPGLVGIARILIQANPWHMDENLVDKLVHWMIETSRAAIASDDFLAISEILDAHSQLKYNVKIDLDQIPCSKYLDNPTSIESFTRFLVSVSKLDLFVGHGMSTTIRTILQEEHWGLARLLLGHHYKTQNIHVLIQKTGEGCENLAKQSPAQLCNLEAAILVILSHVDTNVEAKRGCLVYLEGLWHEVLDSSIYQNVHLCLQASRLLPALEPHFVDRVGSVSRILTARFFDPNMEMGWPSTSVSDILGLLLIDKETSIWNRVVMAMDMIRRNSLGSGCSINTMDHLWKIVVNLIRGCVQDIDLLEALDFLPGYGHWTWKTVDSLFEGEEHLCYYSLSSENKLALDRLIERGLLLDGDRILNGFEILLEHCVDMEVFVDKFRILCQRPSLFQDLERILRKCLEGPDVHGHEDYEKIMNGYERFVLEILSAIDRSRMCGILFVQSVVIDGSRKCRECIVGDLVLILCNLLDTSNSSKTHLVLNGIHGISRNLKLGPRDLFNSHARKIISVLVSDPRWLQILNFVAAQVYRESLADFVSRYLNLVISNLIAKDLQNGALDELTKISNLLGTEINLMIVNHIDYIIEECLVRCPELSTLNQLGKTLINVLGIGIDVFGILQSCFSQIVSRVFLWTLESERQRSTVRKGILHIIEELRIRSGTQMHHFVLGSILGIKRIVLDSFRDFITRINALDGFGFLLSLLSYEISTVQTHFWAIVYGCLEVSRLHKSVLGILDRVMEHQTISTHHLFQIWLLIRPRHHESGLEFAKTLETNLILRSLVHGQILKMLDGLNPSIQTDDSGNQILDEMVRLMSEQTLMEHFLVPLVNGLICLVRCDMNQAQPKTIRELYTRLCELVCERENNVQKQSLNLLLVEAVSLIHWKWNRLMVVEASEIKTKVEMEPKESWDIRLVFDNLVRFVIPLYKNGLSFQIQDVVGFVIQELIQFGRLNREFDSAFVLMSMEDQALLRPFFQSKYRIAERAGVLKAEEEFHCWIRLLVTNLLISHVSTSVRNVLETLLLLVPILPGKYSMGLVNQTIEQALFLDFDLVLDLIFTEFSGVVSTERVNELRFYETIVGTLKTIVSALELSGLRLEQYFSRLCGLDLFRLGLSALENRDFSTCIYFVEQCSNLIPEKIRTLQICEHGLGHVDQVVGYGSFGDPLYHQCQRDYRGAIGLYGTMKTNGAYQGMFECYEAMGLLKEAFNTAKECCRTDPGNLVVQDKILEYAWKLSQWDVDLDEFDKETRSFEQKLSWCLCLIHFRDQRPGFVGELGDQVSDLGRALFLDIRKSGFDGTKLDVFGLVNSVYRDLMGGSESKRFLGAVEVDLKQQKHRSTRNEELRIQTQRFLLSEFSSVGSEFRHELASLLLAKTWRKKGQYSSALDLVLKVDLSKCQMDGDVEMKRYLEDFLILEQSQLCWDLGLARDAIEIVHGHIGCCRNLELVNDVEAAHKSGGHRPIFQSQAFERLYTKIHLKYAQWMIASRQGQVSRIVNLFETAIQLSPNWEKAYYQFSRFQQTLIAENVIQDDDQVFRLISTLSKAVIHGNKYVFETFPKLLTIWLDLGYTSGALFGQTLEICENLMFQIPSSRIFMCLSQIVSRICHPNMDVFRVLRMGVMRMLEDFPHQTLWFLVSVFQSKISMRTSRCNEILSRAKQEPEMRRRIEDLSILSTQLLKIANYQSDGNTKHLGIKDTFGSIGVFPTTVAIPSLDMMMCDIPRNRDSFPLIHAIRDQVDIMVSLQRPKKIVFIGSNGVEYGFLCKPRDDLRKDARFMEIGMLVNRLLEENIETRRRSLVIRRYGVFPLDEECGLIQWVDKTTSFRLIMSTLYNQTGHGIDGKELRRIMDMDLSPQERFVEQLLPRHPPMFHKWFLHTFPNPHEWYRGRLAYTRTCAVISMVGFVMGLGDRHGENILLDMTTGECIHVDFSCLFERGLLLETPEKVPFRLTHNMIDGFGTGGIEGGFRKCSELVMGVLGDRKETLNSILETFVYDPLVEWKDKTANVHGEIKNEQAKKILDSIDDKLSGRMHHPSSIVLSTEGQVRYLISEATSVENLCSMYVGWGPFL